ncbi:NAD-dependent epimerase/dehydratase family protein, partial [Candidatus Sumerlaeota bacterium]|nr:NAD-dependent epimerase/dehydratase family protein [Candidatus Sumerlaeota bacterium]
LVDAFTGVDIVINIAPIFFAPNVVKLCKKTGVSSVLFISSTRKYSRLHSEQAEEIARCEHYIEQSPLDYIILRPTMIYGHPRERNISSLIRYIRRYRIIPLPNKGKSLLQPLFVEDLIDLICRIIRKGAFWRRAYDVAGPTPLTASEVFRILGSETNTRFFLCLLPEWLSGVLCGVLRLLPFQQRHIMQFLAFTEDRTADIVPIKRDLDFTPRDFLTGLRHYLKMHKEKD